FPASWAACASRGRCLHRIGYRTQHIIGVGTRLARSAQKGDSEKSTGQQCRCPAENAERREDAELEFKPKVEGNNAEAECQHRHERAEHGEHDGDGGFPRQAFDVNADEPQQRCDHQWRPFIKPMSMPIPKAPLTTPNGWRRAPASIWEIRVFAFAADAMSSPMPVAASPPSAVTVLESVATVSFRLVTSALSRRKSAAILSRAEAPAWEMSS